MLEEKFNSAIAILEEHNKIVGKEKGFDPQVFIENIKLAGGTTEERLKSFSYEDILSCLGRYESISMFGMDNPNGPQTFEVPKIKPVALAKDIAKIFRGKEAESTVNKTVISVKKADKMTLLELVQNYIPEEDNAVSKRLESIAKNQAFIVFNDKEVDVDATFKLLKEIRDGFPSRTEYNLKKVYKVGFVPDKTFDENPLYKNRPLRPDGTCDQTNRSWDGVPLEVRQLIRIAIDENELIVDIDKSHAILDIAISDDPFGKLARRYRKSAIKFEELKKIGRLPLLKVCLHQAQNVKNGNILANYTTVKWQSI